MGVDIMEYFKLLSSNKVDFVLGSKQRAPQSIVKKKNETSASQSERLQSSLGRRLALPMSDITFLSILNNGCNKKGWTLTFENTGKNELKDNFEVRCQANDIIGFGAAKSKKTAKQMAARSVLLQIAERNELLSSFGLGSTKEEAANYLSNLSAILEADDDIKAATAENWVGKLCEFCTREKINIPEYIFEEKSNNKEVLYSVTCKVGSMKTTAEAKQKKLAKSIAAKDMLLKVEEEFLVDLGKYRDSAYVDTSRQLETVDNRSKPGEDEPIEKSKNVETDKVPTLETPVGLEAQSSDGGRDCLPNLEYEDTECSLLKLLNSDNSFVAKAFQKQIPEYTIFTKRASTDEVQCLLQLKGTAIDEIRVFPGWGYDVQRAKDCASGNALSYAKVLCLYG